MWTEIVVAVISTGGALGGTYLGAFLNRRSTLETATKLAHLDAEKYAKQRLRDERKEAYERIYGELSVMDGAASLTNYYLFGDDLSDPPERYLQSDMFKKHEQDFHNAFQNVHIQMKQQSLILSDEFIALHDEWHKELWKPSMADADPREQQWHFHTTMTNYLPRFKEVGRREIASS